MKTIGLYILIIGGLLFNSCEYFETNNDGSLSNEEIVEGLKTALEIGADTAVSILALQDGYYMGGVLIKILLPPEADIIIDNISKIPGIGPQLIENVILGINRAAEDAANDASPIFKTAITSMTISDGWNILNGINPLDEQGSADDFDSTAATQYLNNVTFDDLTHLYSPRINEALDKDLLGVVNYSPRDAWDELTGKYNDVANTIAGQLLGLTPVTTDIGEYCTGKALNGLFMKVGEEEIKIRRNPYEWAVDIIQKVFGAVMVK